MSKKISSHGHHVLFYCLTRSSPPNAKRSHPHLRKRQHSQANSRSSPSHACGRLANTSNCFPAHRFFFSTQTSRTIQPHHFQLHKDPRSRYLNPQPASSADTSFELYTRSHTTRWCKIRASMCTLRHTVISARGTGSTQFQTYHVPSRVTPTRFTLRLWMASASSLLLTC